MENRAQHRRASTEGGKGRSTSSTSSPIRTGASASAAAASAPPASASPSVARPETTTLRAPRTARV